VSRHLTKVEKDRRFSGGGRGSRGAGRSLSDNPLLPSRMLMRMRSLRMRRKLKKIELGFALIYSTALFKTANKNKAATAFHCTDIQK
jgi:hypothetical protein